MSKPFAPITKPLADMTKDELFELAQERQIPGRHDMKKADLLAAVEEALTAPETEPAPPPEGQDGTEPFAPSPADQDALNEAEPQDDSEPKTKPENLKPEPLVDAKPEDATDPDPEKAAAALVAGRAELEASLRADAQAREKLEREAEQARMQEAQQARREADAKLAEQRAKVAADRAAAHAAGQLTDDDRRDLMRASDGDLDAILLEGDTPEFVRVAVKEEQARRKRQEKLDSAKRTMRTSPTRQFKITSGPAGMRYVTPSAFSTTLPLGSIVSALSYDLKHVAEQGFEWEPIAGVEISEDQLGNQVSAAK